MDDYRAIEVQTAEKHGATAVGTRKSIGDFLLDDNIQKPVNVKSNNVDKNNYSPNIISAKRLINWLQHEGNELYFIFVNDKKIDKVLEQLDSIAGQFKKFDEERELMSDKIREHTDQIESLQNVVFA